MPTEEGEGDEVREILIFGTGDIAEVAHFYLTKDSPREVVAFTADSEFIQGDEFLGLPLVPFTAVEKSYPTDRYGMFVAIGYRDVNRLRARKYQEAKQKGYALISYVNSKVAHWGDTTIGDNTFIFENQTIQPFVKIGNDVVVWSGNHIGHHSEVGDHCFVTSHVVISGHVRVGPYCFLGVNATLRDGISIGEGCVIGAATLVLKDLPPGGVYRGSPAEYVGKASDLKRI